MLPNLAMYFLVKFMFSKIRRPQKLMKSSPSIWHYVVSVKSTVKILSNYVAFLENTNFTFLWIRICASNDKLKFQHLKHIKSLEIWKKQMVEKRVHSLWKSDNQERTQFLKMGELSWRALRHWIEARGKWWRRLIHTGRFKYRRWSCAAD